MNQTVIHWRLKRNCCHTKNKWEFALEPSEARLATRDVFVSFYLGFDFFPPLPWWVIMLQQQRRIRALDGGCEAEAPRCWSSIRQTTKWREGGREEKKGCRVEGRGVGGADVGWLWIVSLSRVSFFTSLCLSMSLSLFLSLFSPYLFFFRSPCFSLVYFCSSVSISASFNPPPPLHLSFCLCNPLSLYFLSCLSAFLSFCLFLSS